MAKSDIEDACDSPGPISRLGKSNVPEDGVLDKSNEVTIHSGHFMVSCVHEADESEVSSTKDEPSEGYDFAQAKQETCDNYQFGLPRDHEPHIDSSLTKLFECMTLAYR